MLSRAVLFLIPGLFVSLALPPTLLADQGVDRFLASQCSQCHGTDGNAVGDMDGLAGEELNDMYDKLLDIKRKDDHDVMHFQIQGYTDDQLYRISRYYSELPEKQSNVEYPARQD